MAIQHDFKRSLEKSERDSDSPLWRNLYTQFFVDFVSMEYVHDIARQRQGIDRIITLENNVKVMVEEKLRAPRFHGDVFLETVSVDTTGAPGWVLKSLACDYIAYVYKSTGIGYMWPFHAVRRAWQIYGEKWTRQYPPIPVSNPGYFTWGVVVPLGQFLLAIQNAEWIDCRKTDDVPF